MKIPASPPALDLLLKESGARLSALFAAVDRGEPYLHWDELRRRPPPKGIGHKEHWLVLKLRRSGESLPLTSTDGRSFTFTPAACLELLHRIDRAAGQRVETLERQAFPVAPERFLASSLAEEAISSSQLEGAATTRQVAKEMLRSGRRPTTSGERMIFNNFQAMERLREWKDEPVTADRILELHAILAAGTLESAAAEGRFRRADEHVVVRDEREEVLHVPPPADELPGRMEAMCRFANETGGRFVHPVVRSILLHLWLAYDHPFVDGNGRTARALFYWSMLRQGYWLCEYLSISRLLRKSPAAYARSFLHVETDDLDATYFVLAQLRVIDRAIADLWSYVDLKVSEVREMERFAAKSGEFNHRQLALLGHALRHAEALYTFESHGTSHGVVRQTARTDLLDLASRGLLVQGKSGRKVVFRVQRDLAKRLGRSR